MRVSEGGGLVQLFLAAADQKGQAHDSKRQNYFCGWAEICFVRHK